MQNDAYQRLQNEDFVDKQHTTSEAEKRAIRTTLLQKGTETQNAVALAKYFGPELVRHISAIHPLSATMIAHHAEKELKNLIRCTRDMDDPLTFHLNTSFKAGKYNVTVLSVRHELMQTRPVPQRVANRNVMYPIACHIHTEGESTSKFLRRTQRIFDDHTQGSFSAVPKILVCDNIPNQEVWNNTPKFKCWDKMLDEVKQFAKKNRNITNPMALTTAVEDVSSLMRSNSKEVLKRRLDQFITSKKGPWEDPVFAGYIKKFVKPVIQSNNGSFNLQRAKISTGQEGVTNSSYQHGRNHLHSWLRTHQRITGQTSDALEFHQMLIACKSLIDSEQIELIRAYFNQSTNIQLKPEYEDFARPAEKMPQLRAPYMSDDIIETNAILKYTKRRADDVDTINEMTNAEIVMQSVNKPSLVSAAAEELLRKLKYINALPDQPDTYIIIDDSDRNFTCSVSQTKPFCTCSYSGWCPHLIATRKYAGVTQDFEVPKISSKLTTKKVPAPRHPLIRQREAASSKRPKKQDYATQSFSDDSDEEEFLLQERISKKTTTKKAPAHVYRHNDFIDSSADQMSTQKKTTMRLNQDDGDHFQLSAKTKKFMINLEQKLAAVSTTDSTMRAASTVSVTSSVTSVPSVSILPSVESDPRTLPRVSGSRSDQTIQSKRKIASYDQHSELFHVPSRHIIQHSNGQDNGFLIDNNRQIVITGSLKSREAEKIIKFAASKVQHHEPTENAAIRVGYLRTKEPLKEVLSCTSEDPRIKWTDLKPICHCRQPEPEEYKFKIRTCNTCSTKFHFDCIPFNTPTDGAVSWSCLTCVRKDSGLKWGDGGITNTCPIDTPFTALTMRCNRDMVFATKVRHFRYKKQPTETNTTAATPMLHILDAAKGGKINSGKIHKIWNTYRFDRGAVEVDYNTGARRSFNDMHGNQKRLFNDLIPEACTATIVTKCDKCKDVVETQDHTQILLPHNPNIRDAVDQAIKTPIQEALPCQHCKDTLHGKMRCQPLQVNSQKIPYALEFEASLYYPVREAMNAPKIIVVPGGGAYELSAINLFSNAEHPTGHYTGILYEHGHFMYYDGMSAPHTITHIPDKVFDHSKFNVNTFLYLKKYGAL